MDYSVIMVRYFGTILGVLVGFAGVAHAAEPSVSFHPKTAWQVSRPAAQQCVLKNEFDNGFIVRISGSNAGKNNVDYLSIDFIQSVFSQKQNYPVSISVPGLVSKNISALAESVRVLQIGMRGHGDLMNALESTGAFDLSLDANNFRFYMTGLSEGIKKFDTCTRGLTQRPALASVEPLRAPSLPKPIYEPMELRRKVGVVPITEILPDAVMANIQEVDLSSPPFAGPKVSSPIDMGPSARPNGGKRTYLDRMRNNEYGDMKSLPSPRAAVLGQDTPDIVASLPVSVPAPVMVELPVLGADVDVKAARAVPLSVPPTVVPSVKGSGSFDQYMKERAARVPAPVSKKAEMPKPLRAKYNRERVKVQADFAADVDRRAAEASMAANEPFAKSYERISTGTKKPKREAAASTVFSGDHNTGMNAKVSELSRKLERLETKNSTLERELSDSYKATEDERLSISSDNWNLERATMRFNEAERQIDKLGRQLQRQRIAHKSEKQELEAMLFDPSLTESSQIAELSRMEAENEALKAKLRAMGGGQ